MNQIRLVFKYLFDLYSLWVVESDKDDRFTMCLTALNRTSRVNKAKQIRRSNQLHGNKNWPKFLSVVFFFFTFLYLLLSLISPNPQMRVALRP